MVQIIDTYDDLLNEYGYQIDDRYMLTVEFKNIEENGDFSALSLGNMSNAMSPAISFIIDENTYRQIDKIAIKVVDGRYRLVLKDGEEFERIEDIETPEQKKIRELEALLAQLKAPKEYI